MLVNKIIILHKDIQNNLLRHPSPQKGEQSKFIQNMNKNINTNHKMN